MDWNSIGYQFWNEYSIKNVVCDCATGKIQVASKEVKKQRRALCNECEFKNKFGFCRKCGCKTDWKTSFVKCKCPVGKW